MTTGCIGKQTTSKPWAALGWGVVEVDAGLPGQGLTMEAFQAQPCQLVPFARSGHPITQAPCRDFRTGGKGADKTQAARMMTVVAVEMALSPLCCCAAACTRHLCRGYGVPGGIDVVSRLCREKRGLSGRCSGRLRLPIKNSRPVPHPCFDACSSNKYPAGRSARIASVMSCCRIGMKRLSRANSNCTTGVAAGGRCRRLSSRCGLRCGVLSQCSS